MFRNVRIRTKILIAFTAIAILAVGATALMAFRVGKAALEQESFNKLTAVREMKGTQIEDYFQQIQDQVVALSKDRMIIDAIQAFSQGAEDLGSELDVTDEQLQEMDTGLIDYYQGEFLPRLAPNVQDEVSISDYFPEDTTARLMQSLYISGNPFETGSKDQLTTLGDDNSYNQAHELYHPIIRDFQERFGYYDIFLVNDEGEIVYTVFKEVDFGTSLEDGPYRDTNFAEAYRTARDAMRQGRDFVYLEDFEPYHPSYNASAAFIASPIYDGDERLGALVFQMPVDRINDIMTSREGWSEVGLGESGETYIVGDNSRIRNQSRFLIEDSENYFRMLEEIGVERAIIQQIRSLGSSIGLQEVQTEGTEAALAGETGTNIFPDYRGVPVLSSYRPLTIPNVDWVIMSEIDEEEAFAAIDSLRKQMLVLAAGLVAVIVLASIFFSRSLTRPLIQLAGNAAELAQGNLDVQVDTQGKDEIGDLARSFDTMQHSINDLVRRQNEAIDALSTPLIPLTEEIVVVPLVGELDERRLRNVSDILTEGLFDSSATIAILDLTGVPAMDETVASHLLRIARKASLLGAKVVITGLQPQVAAGLADLDLHFEGIATERSLQNGVTYAMHYLRNGRHSAPNSDDEEKNNERK